MRQLTAAACLFLLALGCETKSEPHPKTASTAPLGVASVEPSRSSGASSAAAEPGSSDALQTASVGSKAPDFTLENLDGEPVRMSDFKGKRVVLEWFNPGCPFVKLAHTVGSLKSLAVKYADKGVVWLAINSGAPGKQGHGAEANRTAREKLGFDYPILQDETGRVGKAYGATNTPHMFVIDEKGVLIYAGAIDNSPDAEGKSPTGDTLVNYVDAAMEDLDAGRAVRTPKTEAYGCSVKYGS